MYSTRMLIKYFLLLTVGGNETKHYLAFIQEKYLKTEDVVNWLDDEQSRKVTGTVTELYAYWNQENDETVWSVVDH